MIPVNIPKIMYVIMIGFIKIGCSRTVLLIGVSIAEARSSVFFMTLTVMTYETPTIIKPTIIVGMVHPPIIILSLLVLRRVCFFFLFFILLNKNDCFQLKWKLVEPLAAIQRYAFSV